MDLFVRGEDFDNPTTENSLERTGITVPKSTGSQRQTIVQDTLSKHTLTEDALSIIGSDSRKLIACIQSLEALGIEGAVPSLPRFVVVGDQSAGKSSVIEATCDITLPRSEGTTTRCPFKITTTSSNSGAWSCRISVHEKYIYEKGAEKQSPYRDWIEDGNVSITEIVTVHNKCDIAEALCRAHVAILNPSHRPGHFINLDISAYMRSKDIEADDLIEVGFSPNWVALEISGPDLPELSLYDLPGAINVHPDEAKQHLVKFIGDLMKNYMKEEKTLVLLTCPMNSDIENTTAYRYLRQCKAESRSMGVRTKPDMVKASRKLLQQERAILKGNRFQLGGGGWFITRQCSQEELDQGSITYVDARKLEKEFFAQDIWQEALGDFKERLGIPNLQLALSRRLTDHIRQDLPDIVHRVQSRLMQVEEEISHIPKPEDNASYIIWTAISRLTTEINKHVCKENASKEDFTRKFRALFEGLSANFKAATPELELTTPNWFPSVIDIEDDAYGEITPSSKKAKVSRDRSVNTTPTSAKRRPRKTPNVSATSDRAVPKLLLNLGELKEKLDNAPGADVPGQTDQNILRQLMLDSFQNSTFALEPLHKGIEDLIGELLNNSLERNEVLCRPGIIDVARKCMRRYTQKLIEKQKIRNAAQISMQLEVPLTLSEFFPGKLEAVKASYQEARNIQRVKEYFDPAPDGVKYLNRPDQVKKAMDKGWIANNLGSDPYEREINGFAKVVAYYGVVCSTLPDVMAKSTRFHVLKQLSEEDLQDRLMDDLKASDVGHCQQLLLADPQAKHKLEQLSTEKTKLDGALEELEKFLTLDGCSNDAISVSNEPQRAMQ